jgi:hypothetical protein
MAVRDDHSSGTRLAARLARPTRTTGRECPCDSLADRSARPRRSPLFGLAPGGVYPAAPVARGAVRSCRTVSPLPAGCLAALARAVCFLWHFPWGRPRRPLAGTVFPWSPDFPPLSCDSSGRPAVWQAEMCAGGAGASSRMVAKLAAVSKGFNTEEERGPRWATEEERLNALRAWNAHGILPRGAPWPSLFLRVEAFRNAASGQRRCAQQPDTDSLFSARLAVPLGWIECSARLQQAGTRHKVDLQPDAVGILE